jgi:hypothetical protein
MVWKFVLPAAGQTERPAGVTILPPRIAEKPRRVEADAMAGTGDGVWMQETGAS